MDNAARPDGPEASREDDGVTAAAASPRQPPPLPLTIIGGFLGSGKTSLVNHILANAADRRIAVLVNDFGEINIDAKLIVSVKGETVSLANGCICCTIRDDLLTEVIRLLELDSPPDHIVVETSGVSRPIAVAETFLGPAAQNLVDVRNLITMLDADLTVAADAGYGELRSTRSRSPISSSLTRPTWSRQKRRPSSESAWCNSSPRREFWRPRSGSSRSS
jgi:hypothetical protein